MSTPFFQPHLFTSTALPHSMETSTLLIISLIIGFYMSWNIGANDVANAMGTSVGSGSLTLMQAVAIAAVLEFCGAYFFGHRVVKTLQNAILLPTEMMTGEEVKRSLIVAGMLASLLSAGIWLQISSYFGWPVSTTHTTVGAIIGFGLVMGGTHCIHWRNVFMIATSWVFSPLVGGIFSYLFFTFLRRSIFYAQQPLAMAKRLTPVISGCFFGLVSCVLLFDEHREFLGITSSLKALFFPLIIGLICAVLTHLLLRRLPNRKPSPSDAHYRDPKVVRNLEKAVTHLSDIRGLASGEFLEQINLKIEEIQLISRQVALKVDYDDHSEETKTVENIFSYLQIASAAFMAFSHGANDVSNATGPLSLIVNILKQPNVPVQSLVSVDSFTLLCGGVGIVIGLITWGWRVINTVGRKITELTPTRGFAAEFGCATVVMLASQLALPISTTHTLVGSIVGVGLARGLGTVNFDMARKIVFSWIVTIPMGALISIGLFLALRPFIVVP